MSSWQSSASRCSVCRRHPGNRSCRRTALLLCWASSGGGGFFVRCALKDKPGSRGADVHSHPRAGTTPTQTWCSCGSLYGDWFSTTSSCHLDQNRQPLTVRHRLMRTMATATSACCRSVARNDSAWHSVQKIRCRRQSSMCSRRPTTNLRWWRIVLVT